MGTVLIPLEPGDGLAPTANMAAPVQVQGTNFPVAGLAFDATTIESIVFAFQAVNYGSGNINAMVEWYADTANTGNLVLGGAVAAITPNTDSQDIETKAFATEANTSQDHAGTVGQRLQAMNIVISSLDSIADGDAAWFRLRRLATTDTMAGDAIVTRVVLSYSDT